MGTDDDNGQAPAGQRDNETTQRSWVTVAEAAVAGALATDVYNDAKAAGKAIVGKIRKPPSDLGPNMSQGTGDDAGPEAGRPS